jgi:predicted MFS family arabinose efflux permease
VTATATQPAATGTGARQARPLLAATGLAITGNGALNVAAPLLAAAITRSPLAVSTVTAASVACNLVFGLPAGLIVDRMSRRRVIITSNLARAAALAVLAAVIYVHWLTMPILVAALLVISLAGCFFMPASQAMVKVLTGGNDEDLKKVNGRFWAIIMGGQAFTGPAAGSGLYALGRALPALGDAVAYAAATVLIWRLPADPPPAATEQKNIRRELAAGLRHVVTTPDLRAAVLTASAAFNLAVCAVEAVLVLYVRETLGLPAWTYGLLIMAAGAGGVAMSWRSGWLTRLLTVRQGMACGLLLQAAAWLALAATGSRWVAVVSLIAVGASTSVTNVIGSTAIQKLTANDLIGRVMSVWTVLVAGTAVVGALGGGLFAARWGLTDTLYAAAAIGVAGAVLLSVRRHGAGPRPD